MTTIVRTKLALLATAGLLISGLYVSVGHGQEPVTPPPPDVQGQLATQPGVEVLTSGPVHEGYAGPVSEQPRATAVIERQPPGPIEEIPSDQKPADPGAIWIPGYWAWDVGRNDFLWVSGFWRVPPPGRQWVPGNWTQAAAGWQWVPGFWAEQQQQEVAYLPPPPAPVQAAPSVPAPDPQSTFVPGIWVYQETRYVWRPGFWVTYRPGWVWVPAHYVWTPAGYLFVEGYWDLALPQRGLLFTPVYLTAEVYRRPGFVYQPFYCVNDQALVASLFVGPNRCNYYFGDYFEPRYRQLGYTAWVDYRFGRVGYDPLFSYYRWHHREDRAWETGLRDLYAARYNGTAPRPPRTLVQQTTIINSTTVNNTTVNNTAVHNRNVALTAVNTLAMATPITKVNQNVIKLTPVTPQVRTAQVQAAQQLKQFSAQRQKLESQVVAQAPAAQRRAQAPHPVRVEMPSHPQAAAPARPAVQAPPPPVKQEVRHSVAPTHPRLAPSPAPNTAAPVTPAPRPETRPQPAPRQTAPRPEPKPQPAPKPPAQKPEPKSQPAPKPPTEARPPAELRPQPASPRTEPRPQLPATPAPHTPPPARPEVKPPSPPPTAAPAPVQPRPAVPAVPAPAPHPAPRPAVPAQPAPRPEVRPQQLAPSPQPRPAPAPAPSPPAAQPRPQRQPPAAHPAPAPHPAPSAPPKAGPVEKGKREPDKK